MSRILNFFYSKKRGNVKSLSANEGTDIIRFNSIEINGVINTLVNISIITKYGETVIVKMSNGKTSTLMETSSVGVLNNCGLEYSDYTVKNYSVNVGKSLLRHEICFELRNEKICIFFKVGILCRMLILFSKLTCKLDNFAIFRFINLLWKEHHLIVSPLTVYGYISYYLERQKFTKGKNKLLKPYNLKDYHLWIEKHEVFTEVNSFKISPLISIVVPFYNVRIEFLQECINSVLNQKYTNWELICVDDCSTMKHVVEELKKYATLDSRIKVVERAENGHISAATNSGIEIAKGEYIALLDNDDTLSPYALSEVVKAINEHPESDMLYSDEDKIDVFGVRCFPYFKPDYNAELLLGNNYICHFTVLRKRIIDEIGGFRVGYEGAQDHDLFLRFVEKTNEITHIPRILYHWRNSETSTSSNPDSKPYTVVSGLKSIEDAIFRRNLNAVVTMSKIPNIYNVQYNLIDNPLVSIVICTRNQHKILNTCIESIYNKSTYRNFEIILVDNGSNEASTTDLLSYYQKKYDNFKVVVADIPFNYSSLNNMGVKNSSGDYIILLNNDTEVITENWIELMLGYASQDNIGCVGAKLLFFDNTIQHLGVHTGLHGIAGHPFYGAPRDLYELSNLCVVNFSAVTAACLMISKDKYNHVNGLDENLAVAYNDVDFCLRIREAGYRNVCNPYVELYHYESKSRGRDTTKKKKNILEKEISLMLKKWGDKLKNDPFYDGQSSLVAFRLLDQNTRDEYWMKNHLKSHYPNGERKSKILIIKEKIYHKFINRVKRTVNSINTKDFKIVDIGLSGINNPSITIVVDSKVENFDIEVSTASGEKIDYIFFEKEMVKDDFEERHQVHRYIFRYALNKDDIQSYVSVRLNESLVCETEINYSKSKRYVLKLLHILKFNYDPSLDFKVEKNMYMMFLMRRMKKYTKLNTPRYDNVVEYNKWITVKESEKINYHNSVEMQMFHIIINAITGETGLNETVQSILLQEYDNVVISVLVLEGANGFDLNSNVLKEKKLNIVPTNSVSYVEKINEEIKNNQSHYVTFLDSGTIFNKNALNIINGSTSDSDIVYFDNDEIILNNRCNPNFKPDFSYYYFLEHDYFDNSSFIKRDAIISVGYLRQKYQTQSVRDLSLRLVKNKCKILHIPEVLSTVDMKEYNYELQERVLIDNIETETVKLDLKKGYRDGLIEVDFESMSSPLISIIIATRDAAILTKNCIDSIYTNSTYQNFEIILVDNGSVEEQSLSFFQNYVNKYDNFKVIRRECEFNYSYLNNEGVKYSSGEYILLLNNDTEVITKNWIEKMLGYASMDDVGPVGAKLIYEDGMIQHLGLYLGIGGVCQHRCYRYMPTEKIDQFHVVTDLMAVTGACILVERKKYLSVGGLDETLPVGFNDIDFCIKLHKAGYKSIVHPRVVLYHYESKSRGHDHLTSLKFKRTVNESIFMYKRYGTLLINDPYYNKNLSLAKINRLEYYNPSEYYLSFYTKKDRKVILECLDMR